MRILYIEDSVSNIKLLQRLVEGSGHELVIAVDGKQGLNFACSLLPDLIFLDVRLPDGSGLTIIRELRAREMSVPIVAVTACALNRDRELCLEAGCDHYVSKPYDVETILVLLKNYEMSNRSGRRMAGMLPH